MIFIHYCSVIILSPESIAMPKYRIPKKTFKKNNNSTTLNLLKVKCAVFDGQLNILLWHNQGKATQLFSARYGINVNAKNILLRRPCVAGDALQTALFLTPSLIHWLSEYVTLFLPWPYGATEPKRLWMVNTIKKINYGAQSYCLLNLIWF